jgi:hypothetical protein
MFTFQFVDPATNQYLHYVGGGTYVLSPKPSQLGSYSIYYTDPTQTNGVISLSYLESNSGADDGRRLYFTGYGSKNDINVLAELSSIRATTTDPDTGTIRTANVKVGKQYMVPPAGGATPGPLSFSDTAYAWILQPATTAFIMMTSDKKYVSYSGTTPGQVGTFSTTVNLPEAHVFECIQGAIILYQSYDSSTMKCVALVKQPDNLKFKPMLVDASPSALNAYSCSVSDANNISSQGFYMGAPTPDGSLAALPSSSAASANTAQVLPSIQAPTTLLAYAYPHDLNVPFLLVPSMGIPTWAYVLIGICVAAIIIGLAVGLTLRKKNRQLKKVGGNTKVLAGK